MPDEVEGGGPSGTPITDEQRAMYGWTADTIEEQRILDEHNNPTRSDTSDSDRARAAFKRPTSGLSARLGGGGNNSQG